MSFVTFMNYSVWTLYVCRAVAAFLLLTGAASCGSSKTDPEEVSQKNPAADSTSTATNAPLTVSLSQAQYNSAGFGLGQPESRTLSTTIQVNGVLDVPPQSQVSVSVPYGGYIRSIKLEPGTRVRKGQTLAVLENPEFIQLQQDYLDTRARLDYADLEYARQQELSRDNVNALKIVQKTRSDRLSLQAQLAGLGKRLALLHLNPATLRADRLTSSLVVPSPVAGYVTNVPVNNGRFVNPSDVIVEVTDVRDLHVHLSIFEKDITRIHAGQVVQFGLGNNTAPTHWATIFLKAKSIATDRTIAVLAHPSAWSDDFIPGAFVAARIAVTTEPLSVLPDAAVVSLGGKSYVYVLEEKAGQPVSYRFRQIEVKTGLAQNGYTAITLPPTVNTGRTPIVVRGAYSLLSQQNNSGEE